MQKSQFLRVFILTPIVAFILASLSFVVADYPSSLAGVRNFFRIEEITTSSFSEKKYEQDLLDIEQRLRGEIEAIRDKKDKDKDKDKDIESSISTANARHILSTTVQISYAGSAGSGVVIYESKIDDIFYTYIITNNHVVDEEKEVTVTRFNYLKNSIISSRVSYTGKVIGRNAAIDIALIELQIPESIGPSASFASNELDSTLTLYQPVYISGCPLTNPPLISNGNVGFISETRALITAFAIFGSSGSGVYNTQGKLVGLVRSVANLKLNNNTYPESNLTNVIPGPLIRSWLLVESFSFVMNDGTHRDFLASRKAKK